MNDPTDVVDSTLREYSRWTTDSKAFISAKKTSGMALDDTIAQIDMRKLRAYRLTRLQSVLRARDIAAAVLFDPINVRYATGTRNMTVWLLHNHGRYCVVPAEGKVILFEYPNNNCMGLAEGIEVIGDIRRAVGWSYFFAGEHVVEICAAWAREIADLVSSFAAGNRRIGVDRLDPLATHELESLGFTLLDAQECCEVARAVKSPEEIACMNAATVACDIRMARMRERLQPGITENSCGLNFIMPILRWEGSGSRHACFRPAVEQTRGFRSRAIALSDLVTL